MAQQLHFFAGACAIFFGETSIPFTAVTALIALVKQNRHILKAREVNKLFIFVCNRHPFPTLVR